MCPGRSILGLIAPDQMALGNDVGDQLRLHPEDLVLEDQFAFLQALDLQLVERPSFAQMRNYVVKVAMLAFQHRKLVPQLFGVWRIHWMSQAVIDGRNTITLVAIREILRSVGRNSIRPGPLTLRGPVSPAPLALALWANPSKGNTE